MAKMRTAVFRGIRNLSVEECDKPLCSDNKILIKVDACAICTWEQRVYTGVNKVDFPFIGGHEIAAEIVEIGRNVNANNWKIGDKVVYGTNLACGDCYQCKTGNEQNCVSFDHSKQLEGLPYRGMGGLSEYMLAEPKHLFKYYNIPVEHATIAEPISCVVHSVETADIQLGDVVVVIGCGIMGQLHAQIAAKRGAVVIVSDINDGRTEEALKFGAGYKVNPEKQNLKEIVMKVSNGAGAQVVFDTTPISSVISDGASLLSSNGRMILYSSFHPDVPAEFSPNMMHHKAIQFLGTANSNSRDFIRASILLSQKIINVEPYISEVYDIEHVKEAFESAVKGDKYRVIIKF